MKVMLIGGTGTISSAVVESLLARGDEVVLLNRGNKPAPDGVRLLKADIHREDEVKALLEGEQFDCVCEFTGFVAEDALRDIRLFSGKTEQGLMNKVGNMVPAIERMLPKLDSIMASLNILLADPALRNTLHNVEGMTGNLNATSAELKTLSASLNREMPAMMQKTNGVLDNTQQLTGNLAAIDIAEMTEKVNKTLANVEQMTQKLNSNEGTLGLLMRDATLYHNLSSTAASADSLLIDLKEHPKRYVHFSIFGRKDN